jgi:hypothetical protein
MARPAGDAWALSDSALAVLLRALREGLQRRKRCGWQIRLARNSEFEKARQYEAGAARAKRAPHP